MSVISIIDGRFFEIIDGLAVNYPRFDGIFRRRVHEVCTNWRGLAAEGMPSIISRNTTYDWGFPQISIIDGIDPNLLSPQIAWSCGRVDSRLPSSKLGDDTQGRMFSQNLPVSKRPPWLGKTPHLGRVPAATSFQIGCFLARAKFGSSTQPSVVVSVALRCWFGLLLLQGVAILLVTLVRKRGTRK
jgi:hypothetical protein